MSPAGIESAQAFLLERIREGVDNGKTDIAFEQSCLDGLWAMEVKRKQKTAGVTEKSEAKAGSAEMITITSEESKNPGEVEQRGWVVVEDPGLGEDEGWEAVNNDTCNDKA